MNWQLLHKNVQRLRGGLVFKAHGFCVSTPGKRITIKKKIGKHDRDEPESKVRRDATSRRYDTFN
jgi:hypothetical protein